jgi:glycosyltransferase involved in cell wall biosynthesis
MTNKLNPLVSVIITTKNSEKYIKECLYSIKKQSYKKIESIVVDNNSIDHTKEIAEKYTKSIYNKGPERSAQRNFGAKKTKGDFLLFIATWSCRKMLLKNVLRNMKLQMIEK